MRSLALIPASLFLLVACGDKEDGGDAIETDPTVDRTTGDSGDGSDGADGTDGADGSDGTATVASLAVDPETAEVTTRETVAYTLTATYDDDSEADVTADAVMVVDDGLIARVYTAGVVQPLGAGVATVSADLDGASAELVVTVTVAAAEATDLVLNEVLADGTVEGDPNGDGDLDATDDEFIEIANLSGVSVDLSGCTLEENDVVGLPRHTFAEGTVLMPGAAIVVFGGGDVSGLSGDHVTYVTADNADAGVLLGLDLGNAADRVRLKSPAGDVLAELCWGELFGATDCVDVVEDASMTRDVDVTGEAWGAHGAVTGDVGSFSPGTTRDGGAFGGPDAVFGTD